MRRARLVFAGLVAALLLAGGINLAGDLNEVGALLVYPAIVTDSTTETFITITNAGSESVLARFIYINGDDGADSAGYCAECDFEIELTGNDTETLVLNANSGGQGITLSSLDSDFAMSCPFPYGMLAVTQEDGTLAPWNTRTNNVLLGEQVVVNYEAGHAYSIPAIPFQGGQSNNDFRNYTFDDNEYSRLPRVVAADFLAPRAESSSRAVLALFTLGFEQRYPPVTDCSVIGFDANENPFSTSFQFGCWAVTDLCDISPEFCHPNLGLYDGRDSHGWLQLSCRVDQDPPLENGFDVHGGVHGAIIQYQSSFSTLPAGSGARFQSEAVWGRLLYQSVTTGDAVTLRIQAHPFL
jgi:hypothetical protein